MNLQCMTAGVLHVARGRKKKSKREKGKEKRGERGEAKEKEGE